MTHSGKKGEVGIDVRLMRQRRDFSRSLYFHRCDRGQVIDHVCGVLVHGTIRGNERREGGVLVLRRTNMEAIRGIVQKFYEWKWNKDKRGTHDLDELRVEVLAVDEVDLLLLDLVGETKLGTA